MKIKDSFILRNVAGQNLVVPIGGDSINLNVAITLNETGAFIWEKMTVDTTKEAVVDALLKEYDVDRETAEKDVDAFIEKLNERSILETNEK